MDTQRITTGKEQRSGYEKKQTNTATIYQTNGDTDTHRQGTHEERTDPFRTLRVICQKAHSRKQIGPKKIKATVTASHNGQGLPSVVVSESHIPNLQGGEQTEVGAH